MKIKFINSNRPELTFTADEITVGREVDNMLILESDGVSRHHGRIYCRDGKYFIEDLGSTNGIKVNGTKISSPVELKDMDFLDFHKEKLQISDLNPSAAAATVIMNISDTAKISLSEVLTGNTDDSVSIDPVIVPPAAEDGKINSITLTPTDEISEGQEKEQDFDKIAEFLQQNTSNLFNSVRSKNNKSNNDNASADSGSKKFSNKLFYVVLCCAVLVIGVWVIKIITPAPQKNSLPKEEKTVDYPLYLMYVKENTSKNNVFRFTLLIENNSATFTIDDLKSQLKFGPVVKSISETEISKLKQAIRESNFFKLAPVSEGDTYSQDCEYKDLEIFLGPVNKRISLKNRPTPREFMDVEESLNLLAESCNMKTALLSPEELRVEAQNHFLSAEDKFANYETDLSNLKQAINSYTVVIEYLAGISPEPKIRKEAVFKREQAIKIRNTKIKEYDSQYKTMISQSNIAGAKQSLDALLRLYDTNSRQYLTTKQRLIKIDTLLRRTKNKR